MRNRLVSVLMICCMAIVLIPTEVLAVGTYDSNNIRVIAGFDVVSQEVGRFVCSIDEKPELNNLVSEFPDSMKVYFADNGDTSEVSVSWYCLTDDFSQTSYSFYRFVPQFDSRHFELSQNIDPYTDLPYIGVYMTNEGEATLQSVTSSPNEAIIYNYLRNGIGLTTASACGVMANIQYESNFNPNLYGDDGTSYGICQWHNDRFQSLKDYCRHNGYDYESVEGQLFYLEYELYTKYSGVFDTIKNVDNTPFGAYYAAFSWCFGFENPANRVAQARSRAGLARIAYWPEYTGGHVHQWIRKGSSGQCVRELQDALNKLISAGLDVDGSFGPAVDTALRNYQSSRGLGVDGSCGPATWDKI